MLKNPLPGQRTWFGAQTMRTRKLTRRWLIEVTNGGSNPQQSVALPFESNHSGTTLKKQFHFGLPLVASHLGETPPLSDHHLNDTPLRHNLNLFRTQTLQTSRPRIPWLRTMPVTQTQRCSHKMKTHSLQVSQRHYGASLGTPRKSGTHTTTTRLSTTCQILQNSLLTLPQMPQWHTSQTNHPISRTLEIGQRKNFMLDMVGEFPTRSTSGRTSFWWNSLKLRIKTPRSSMLPSSMGESSCILSPKSQILMSQLITTIYYHFGQKSHLGLLFQREHDISWLAAWERSFCILEGMSKNFTPMTRPEYYVISPNLSPRASE